MEISGLIDDSSFMEDLIASDRKTVFNKMVDHLVASNQIPADLRDKVILCLEDREAKMSTAIGEGIAIPHASVQGIPEVITLIAILEGKNSGIDCHAPDERPVRIFFMILVPFDQYSVHLRTLATVTRFLNQPGIKERLQKASNAFEMRNIIKK
ncbi:MAG: PTS sugar transporter subunit IIA [Verrucomicrobiota bacterium]